MTKSLSGLLIFLAVFCVVSTARAQWWGSESLPGNPSYYTYRTRLGYWQYGALERNITTPQRFADRGIIPNWNDGSPIAVDRNLPGGRFAQQGVPNLTYVPQIDYYDKLGYLTDVEYRSGLRQYWPEDQHLLFHEWEQISYEHDRLPANSSAQAASPATVPQESRAATQDQRSRVQTVVIQPRPAKPAAQPKQNYHERIMQGYADRRDAEEERNRRYAAQYAEALAQAGANQSGTTPRTSNPYQVAQPPMSVDPIWFRDQMPQQPMPLQNIMGNPADYKMSSVTYIAPVNPMAEREKRLEYALAGSREISFFSPFQTKFENGTVTVTGIVGSEEQRQTAERILLTQPDVLQVQNLLTVAE